MIMWWTGPIKLIVLVGVIWSTDAASLPPADYTCPSLCTCDISPLHTAPFMSSWIRGTNTLNNWNENEVFDQSAMLASSGESAHSGISFNDLGLHVTCAIYPDTNITRTVEQLPTDTMVLSLLQATTDNCTIIDGDQLANLIQLRALHIKGFISVQQQQEEVTLVITDEALKPLLNLQILDLNHVRILPKIVIQRLRRHTHGPLRTINMIDMSISKFLRYADDLELNQSPDPIANANSDSDGVNIINEELKVVLLNNQSNNNPVSYEFKIDDSFFAPFTSLLNLKFLRIANARLEELKSEMLVGLLNLRSVILEHNDIKILPSDIFAHTPNVRYLNLGHNSILTLDPKSLQGLTKLEYLSLAYNRLAVTGPATLPHLPKLKVLDLRGNPIKNILPDSFIFANSTETLTLGSTVVSTEILPNAFNNMVHLKSLTIYNYTSINFKGEFFSGIPNLEELTIHGSIESINFDAFTRVQNLKKLDLSHSKLNKISVDAFFGLSNLTVLDLSSNQLNDIIPGTFDNLRNLNELYLQNNNLTTLSIGLFTPLKVKILRLNQNPWECTCTLMQLRPTMTNTIIHPKYNVCYLDSKGLTACEEKPERIVFDSRVAPKCHSPAMFRHKDVYLVAHRYLKCSKHHWDPLVYTDTPQPVHRDITTALSDTKTTIKSSQRTRGRNWRPLVDYTPEPLLPVDLLNIAETDQLEEVEEDEHITVMPQADHSEAVNDEVDPLAAEKAEYKRKMELERSRYLADKKKIKEQLTLQGKMELSKLATRQTIN